VLFSVVLYVTAIAGLLSGCGDTDDDAEPDERLRREPGSDRALQFACITATTGTLPVAAMENVRSFSGDEHAVFAAPDACAVEDGPGLR
jgi:hypothetical protein